MLMAVVRQKKSNTIKPISGAVAQMKINQLSRPLIMILGIIVPLVTKYDRFTGNYLLPGIYWQVQVAR